jgi:hypothetical protein
MPGAYPLGNNGFWENQTWCGVPANINLTVKTRLTNGDGNAGK